jgi:hypothetical protein
LEKQHEDRKLAVGEIVSRGFGVIMVVLYLGIGATIIFKAHDFPMMPSTYAIILGGFFIFYGGVRAYKLYQKYFSPPSDEPGEVSE